jgi:O-antigen ligase/Flp pilus assembly protein TadD
MTRVAEKTSSLCDRAVIGGLVFLIVATPVAFGAVHPWAFIVMEAVVFLLVALWMIKLSFCLFASSRVFPLLLPLMLFAGFALFQLTSLPPTLLRALSPATYEFYTQTFPGWPEKIPYDQFQVQSSKFKVQSSELPAPSSQLKALLSTQHSLWLPLSLAPELSLTELLKLMAYAGLFFVTLLYPVGLGANQQERDRRFVRTVMFAVLCAGTLVAALGIAQRLTWNGKILWFFVPHDWSGPHLGESPRASGPFVNADHFGNYLALIFPLTLVGVVSRRAGAAWGKEEVSKLWFGGCAVLLLMGILLSLSRGAWIGSALGVLLLMRLLPSELRPSFFVLRRGTIARLLGVVTAILALLAVLLIGPSGREQVDVRLERTVSPEETSLRSRLVLWRDSLNMLGDFPLFGVGLGAWPEVFPRYQRPPWSPLFAREAHNDYVQRCAELGVVGSGLLAWFFVAVGRQLYKRWSLLSANVGALYAGVLASLIVMAFHEIFDFNLQIPANAALCAVLLGVALRLARPTGRRFSPRSLVAVGATGMGALTLGVLVFGQERLPYPDNLQTPGSVEEARATLLSYPALSSMHMALFEFTEESQPLARRLSELEIALWLNPREPFTRDLYAQTLLQLGREQEGLREMTRSLALAPRLADHDYLSRETIGSLGEKEQRAVEEGLRNAVALRYDGAVEALASFHGMFDRHTEAALLYEEAAHGEGSVAARLAAFLNAGLAFTKAGEGGRAEVCFRQAMRLAPRDPRPYRHLALEVFAVQEDLDGARAVISEGMRNGAEPTALVLSLSEAARKVGDRATAKTVLTEALKRRGARFDILSALGRLYVEERNFDRAAVTFRKAAKLRPNDASVLYQLAMAEEGRAQFAAAQQAYVRAVSLEPHNEGIRQRYEMFQRKTAEERRENIPVRTE